MFVVLLEPRSCFLLRSDWKGILRMSLFFLFLWFDIRELADPVEKAPSRVSQFLEILHGSSLSTPSLHTPTNPESRSPNTPLLGSHTPGHYPPALIIPKAGRCQLIGTASWPKVHWDYSNQHSKGSRPHFPFTPLPPGQPSAPLWAPPRTCHTSCFIL